MNLSLLLSKEIWIILFALGAQLHFYGIIFPEIRESIPEFIGIGLVIISASLMLILYNISGKNKSNFVGVTNQ